MQAGPKRPRELTLRLNMVNASPHATQASDSLNPVDIISSPSREGADGEHALQLRRFIQVKVVS